MHVLATNSTLLRFGNVFYLLYSTSLLTPTFALSPQHTGETTTRQKHSTMRPLTAFTLTILALVSGSTIAKTLDKGTHFAILVGCAIFGVFVFTQAWASAEPSDNPEEEEVKETKKETRRKEREVRRMLIKECWPKKNTKLGRVREDDVEIEYD
jgi:Na+/melibiose symporter-like transporter